MNIVFYILVLLGAGLLYFISSGFFGILGRFFSGAWEELLRNIRGEEENGKE